VIPILWKNLAIGSIKRATTGLNEVLTMGTSYSYLYAFN
jgi:hypothetical protein